MFIKRSSLRVIKKIETFAIFQKRNFLRDSASGTRTEVPKLKFYGAYIPFLFRSFELEIKRLEQVDTCIIMGDAGLWIPEW
jgi:hypothetical protein